MEEIEYFFKHALVQEAAYKSILLQKQKELHLKVVMPPAAKTVAASDSPKSDES